MNFHLCCVVLALAVSSSTAMPGQCTIPAVEHGQVGRYSTKIFQDDRFRECFTQILTGEKVSDSNSVTLRCEKGYLPAGSSQISKVHRFKEDVVTCEDGTWSKPLRCEAEITCGEPPPIEYAATISLFTEDYPLGSIVSYECQSGYVIKGRTTASQCVMSDDGSQAVWTKAPMSCVAQSCGDPGIVANAHRIGSDFTFPHTAEYECEEGYKLNGTGVRHCEPSGMWSGKLPTCEPQSCGDPGLVINASRIGSEFTFPHTVKFECEESYKLNGTDVRQCQADGLWSGKLPTCEKVHCERPRNPENGNVSFISLEYGTELRYECNKGFNLSNHQQRRCIGNGTWSNEEPVCKAQTCGDPGFVVNASRTGNDFTFPHTVKFECDEGYKLNGTDVLQCQADGLWSGKLPTCEQRSCGDPGLVVNASRIGSEFTFPHTVKFECKEGYKLNGTGVRQCQADGAWSGKLPTCERIYCERPRNPENGNVSFISLEYGTELRYECNKGFNLNNHQQRHCTGNGTWSNEEPACKEVTCDDPQAPDNGFRQLTDGLKVDSSVIYSCADGKMLVGESTSKCLIDGHWTFTPPECVDISCGEPPPIEFATVTSLFTKEYPLGAIVAYECQLGYVIKGRTATSQCVMSDDGSQAIWTKAQLSCSANATCGHPPQMFGAIYPNVQGRKFPIGTKVTYTCASGYVGKGSDRYESVCEYLKPLRRGLWTYPDAYCRPQSCGDPGFVANASRIGSDFTFRRTVKFECKEGYKLKGTDVLSCEANGTWSGELPTCERSTDPPSRPEDEPIGPPSIAINAPDLCRDAKIDAITRTQSGTTYAFKGNFYWKVHSDGGIIEGFPRRISDDWGGLEGDLDASFTWSDGKTYFFKGRRYWLFTGKKMDTGYPRLLSVGFEGIPGNLDAAVVWNGNGKPYFFKGAQYWRYDSDADPPVNSMYPLSISEWKGVPYYIDAAVRWDNNKTYFFKGDKYYRYNDMCSQDNVVFCIIVSSKYKLKIKGFDEALIEARELAKDLDAESVFKTPSKPLCKKRKLFYRESTNEPLPDTKTAFTAQCFNQLVDKALHELEPPFKQLKKYHNLFGFLYSFQVLSKYTIRKCAVDLEVALIEIKLAEEKDKVKTTKLADIHGYMLTEAMVALMPILPSEIQNPMKMLEFLACNLP